MKQLPIGIQTFEEIRKRDLLYVDKTDQILGLIQVGKYYFFARPRRFGKSLLLSTLKSFFEGRADLFKGLYLYNKIGQWTKHPVIYIDYSLIEYKKTKKDFEHSILSLLKSIADFHQVTIEQTLIPDYFRSLVQTLDTKYGKVVILVDEYDKALTDSLHLPERFTQNKEVLRSLYSTFKGLDAHIRFVMLTGVSRFSKIGIFSGLNNLEDISMDDRFSTIVGFTQDELEQNFSEHLNQLSKKTTFAMPFLMTNIKYWYNGFSWDGINRLYNPFSLFNLFNKKAFNNYWFSTGTPTFLINLIKEQKKLPETFENIQTYDLVGSSESFKNFPLIPILFQTGYLTIDRIIMDGVRQVYQLTYPNEEVRHSLITYIAAEFINKDLYEIQPEAIKLRDALLKERPMEFIKYLQSFFADIPARLHLPKEAYYHSLVYMMLRLTGTQILLEKETDKGRIDGVLELSDKVYIIEFKFATNKRVKRVETLAQKAILQIEEKKYYEAFLASGKKIILFGIGFLDKKIAGQVKYI